VIHRTAGAALLLAALAVSVRAQGVHGLVHDSASHQPIPGAVVMVLDSAGTTLVRNITDETGAYRLALAGTSARLVRVVRIGFQPRDVRMPPPAGGDVSLDINMLRAPTMLAGVRVEGESHCPRRSDRDAALGLWEQARAGLLTTVVARESRRAAIRRFVFERAIDRISDRVTSFHVQTDSADNADRSFNSARSAGDFIKWGFASDSAKVESLFGPDGDVLLDEAFASAYCFRVAAPSKSRPSQVGLGFAPADSRMHRVDIEGTLWIDTAARVLTDIEFRYVGLPGHTDHFSPGGKVSFRQMTNGVVLIDQWYLRGVAMEYDTIIGALTHVKNYLHPLETGGVLARATWPDGQTWHAPLATVRIHVGTPDGKPAAGAAISFPDTPYGATLDTNGDATITDVLPGPYELAIDPRPAAGGPVQIKVLRDGQAEQVRVVVLSGKPNAMRISFAVAP
jgi:hypothetical protein